MSQRKSRIKVIISIYQSELFNQEIDPVLAFEDHGLSKSELHALEWIKAKHEQLKNLISNNLLGWNWTRITALERAILLYGAFELSFRDKAIVINELVDIAKEYLMDDKYKYINSVLQKIGDGYEANK